MRLVRDQIWVGNSSDAKNLVELKRHKIANVLNVAFDLDSPQYDTIGLYKVGLCDGPSSVNPVADAVAVLSLLVAQGKPCLVHCHEGKCRSALVVALYFHSQGQILEEAIGDSGLKRKDWMDDYLVELQ